MSFTKKLLSVVLNKGFLIGLVFILTILVWVLKNNQADDGVKFLADDSLIKEMLSDIEFSRESIFISIYMFKTDGTGDADQLKDALIRAAGRGVKVYVVMDVAKEDITTEANTSTGKELSNHGIMVKYDSPLRKLHSKLMIIDEKIVYIGSHNYTNSAFSKNNETSVRIISDKIAKEAISYIKNIKTYEQ
ncbi:MULTISPECIES: phospholipase D-like domain-containing protein [Calditerrivibrio]|jgi:phosphatidylserine/phosphatidylglycerophosphate/cardiolipin synthase-like enzyme|uniref:phospholipase D n=1 Tax=Calditerrivibrio nitroreducens TaxID=477976 RepID=A0A2J6WMT1_9BACT|nr:MAG: hypothetical protein C0187_03350 [Calditerrivibrio nitroreducens]